MGSMTDIIEEAKRVIEDDSPLPDLPKIEWKPYCKRCGEPCALLMMPKAILPVSDCCKWFYGLDVEFDAQPSSL